MILFSCLRNRSNEIDHAPCACGKTIAWNNLPAFAVGIAGLDAIEQERVRNIKGRPLTELARGFRQP
jgi:hypothetical protein